MVEEAVVVAEAPPEITAPSPVATEAVAERTEMPDYETLANKLQGVLTRLRSVEVIEDEISGFDIKITSIDAEIAALESKRAALLDGRADAVARLPTAEELQKMQLLASML